MSNKRIEFPLSFTLDERIERRVPLNEKKVLAIWAEKPEKRLKYFFSKIVEHEELWTLWENEELLEYALSNDCWGIPVWPNKEFADKFARTTKSTNWRCIPIPLDDFINDVIFAGEAPSETIIFPQKLDEYSYVQGHDTFVESIKNEFKKFQPKKWW